MRFLNIALFLSLFVLYVAGQAGTIPSYRDAGDFIAAISQLGIAHPPGYPLYILLGKLALVLCPWANAAYRLHLLSAVFAALAAVCCLKAAERWAIPTMGAVLAIVSWAVSPAVIELARVDEMYTLAALCASLLLWVASFPPSDRKTILMFYLLGVSMVAHPTLMFFAPLVFATLRRESDGRSWGMAIAFGAVGLSLYFYLPIRAWQHPLSNWGDPGHWRNFWRVVTRADYGGLRLHPVESQFAWTADDVIRQLFYFFKAFGNEWRWVGLFFGAWGIIAPLVSVERKIRLGLFVTWALVGPLFFILSNLSWQEATTPAILQPYLLVAGIAWIPLVFFGAADVQRRWPSLTVRAAGILVTFGLIAGGVKTAVEFNHRADFFAYDYGRNLMRSLPKNAVLYDPDDPTAFTLRALQVTEHRRTDIMTLNFFRTRWGYEQLRERSPDFLPPGDVANAQDLESLFWSYSIKRRPFYVELPQKLEGRAYAAEALVYRAGASHSSQTLRDAQNNFERYVVRGRLRTRPGADFFTNHLIDYYAAGHTNLGLDLAAEKSDDAAIDQYRFALLIDPDMAVPYNDWGVLEYNRRHFAQAAALYRRAVGLDPTNAGFQRNLDLAQRAF